MHFECTIWLAHWLTDDTLRKVPLKCSFFFPHFSREKASLLSQGRIWVPWKALSWVRWKLSFHHHDLSLQRGQGSRGLSAAERLSPPPPQVDKASSYLSSYQMLHVCVLMFFGLLVNGVQVNVSFTRSSKWILS